MRSHNQAGTEIPFLQMGTLTLVERAGPGLIPRILAPSSCLQATLAPVLEEWLGKLIKCRLSQLRLGPGILNFNKQPKWF